MHESDSTTARSLSQKLGVYAALGAGCTTFSATAADADIIYTDLRGGNELVFRTSNSATQFIDLDNDGFGDFKLGFSSRLNGFGTISELINLSARPGGPAINAFIGTSFYLHGASVFNAPSGFAFSHFANYWYTNAALAYHYTAFLPSLSGGQFQNRQIGYGLVRFQDGTGNTRFGWIEFVSGANLVNGIDPNDVFQVTRYAYAIDMPIVAGQVPEPAAMTSIGLLALGAVGLTHRRRRLSGGSKTEDTDSNV